MSVINTHLKPIELFHWDNFKPLDVVQSLQLDDDALVDETLMLLDNQTWNEDVLQRFYAFMYERQLIWYKRFVLEEPAPWTEDPILLVNKFTNVERRIDRGSLYLFRQILSKLDGSERMERMVLFNILAYRYLNKVESWDACVGFIDDWDKDKSRFITELDSMQKHTPVFTAAHMLPPLTNVPGATKVQRLAHLLTLIWEDYDNYFTTIKTAPDLKSIYKHINSRPWFGRFLSYEMTVDISYTDITPHNEDQWTSSGPGSIRGINFMLDTVPNVKAESHPLYTAFLTKLRNDQAVYFEKLGLDFKKVSYNNIYLTLRDIEHSTCEFCKYYRTVIGQGRPKERFKPKSITAEEINKMRG